MHPSARVSHAFAFILVLVGAPSQLLAAEVSALDEDVSWIDLQAVPDDAVKADPMDRFLIYREESERRGLAELWSAPLGGGAPVRLSGGLAPGDEVDDFAASPDGRWVVGARRLYQVPIAGGVPMRVDSDLVPIADPCADVRIRPGFDLTVQGALIAVGTPSRRIAFRRDDPALAWDSIWAKSPGVARLAFVDVSGGGAAGASVIGEGVDTLPPAAPLLLDHVKVTGSAGYGVRLFRRAGFAAGSNNLVVSGSGAADPSAPFPVRMSLNTVGTLPTGIYTGNASDLIQVVGEGNPTVEIDDAFHHRGVPYQVGGPAGAFGLVVVSGTSSVATLTVDPGVEIRFYSAGSNYGGLFVGTSGATSPSGRLVAGGTGAAPIVFTGAGGAPVAGSWEGITFFGALAAGNVLDHVRIDAAGRNGGDAGFGCPPASFAETSGALKVFSQPGASFLANSTISRSSTHGVFRAWTGAQVDFLTGNTFEQVAFCKQVLPKPTPPAVCPAMPPCP